MDIDYELASRVLKKYQSKDVLFDPINALEFYLGIYRDATKLNGYPIFLKNGELNPVVKSMAVPVSLKLYEAAVDVYRNGKPDNPILDIGESLDDKLDPKEDNDNSYNQPGLFYTPTNETAHLKPDGKRKRKR